MTFKVMYRQGRQTERSGQSFGKRRADQQGSRQSGPLGIGNGIKLTERAPAIGQNFAQQGYDAADVVA
jgi:hypothetical protein